MSKHDDPSLVRTAVAQRLKVHVRLAQQGINPTPKQRQRLAHALPQILPFGDRHYARPTSSSTGTTTSRPRPCCSASTSATPTARPATSRRALKLRDREIDGDNLYPEFDVPDYGELDASETYIGLVRTANYDIEELRFFSDWRKSVQQPIVREVLGIVRNHPGYDRSMRERSHDNLGPPVVIGWTPPCLANSKHWAVEVWLLVDFDGHMGRAHVFMVDNKAAHGHPRVLYRGADRLRG
jgi:hypothetical protein